MNRIPRETMRAWIWPNDHSTVFASKPTPYNISRLYGLPTSSVYDEWHRLFNGGSVQRVILLPSDSFSQRSTVAYQNAGRKDFDAISGMMKELPFVEMVRWGKVRVSYGMMDVFRNEQTVMFVDVVGTSEAESAKREGMISEIVSPDVTTLRIPQPSPPQTELSQRLSELARTVSYSNILELKLNRISSVLNVSTRTARRWMDSLLGKKVLSTYPLIGRCTIKDQNIVIAYGLYDSPEYESSVVESIKKDALLSQRYLHYRLRNGMIILRAFYDNSEEIASFANSFRRMFSSFVLLTDYETKFNDYVTIGTSG